MSRRLALAAAFLCLAAPAMATPPPPPQPPPPETRWRTADEIDEAEPAETARVLTGDYSTRFVERRSTDDGFEFYARPRPAVAAGFCTVEMMRLTLWRDAPTSRRGVRSVSVSTLHQAAPEGGCNALPAGAAYFTAPTELAAYRGYATLQRAIAAAPTLTVACTPRPVCNGRQLLATTNLTWLESVSVDTQPTRDGRGEVWRVHAQVNHHGDHWRSIDIEVAVGPRNGDVQGPERITAVSISGGG